MDEESYEIWREQYEDLCLLASVPGLLARLNFDGLREELNVCTLHMSWEPSLIPTQR